MKEAVIRPGDVNWMTAGRGIIHDGMLLTTEIIPRPHADFVRALLSQGSF